MKKTCFLIFSLLTLNALSQNFPVAVNDTVQVMNQKLIEIYPLLNDYDPDGDTIEIILFNEISHGESWYEDSIVYYKSEPYEGWASGKYMVGQVGNWGYQSDFARIKVEVLENPDIPLAIDDSLHAKYLEETILFPLHNDYDPNGDSIIIEEVEYWAAHYCDVSLSEDSTYVIFTSEYAPNGYAWFEYRIIEKNTQDKYLSLHGDVRVYLDENEDLPIARQDNFEVVGGIEKELLVLENDHDPLDDTLEFFDVENPGHGTLEINGEQLFYTANISYTGEDEFEYSIRYKNQAELYSQSAKVKIWVEKNPNCPVGISDTGSGMAFSPIAVEVISNDFDPIGDSIEIFDVKTKYGTIGTNISFSGDTVYYTSPGYILGRDTAFYKIRKKNNQSYYSEWIPIIYNIKHNPELPLCRPDSAVTYGGIPVLIDMLANDDIPDSINIHSVFAFAENVTGNVFVIGDSIVYYNPFSRMAGCDTINYYCFDYQHPASCVSSGKIYVDIYNSHAYDSVSINNINAGVNSNAYLFTKANYNEDYFQTYMGGHFEYPKGTGINSIFLNTIWLGGYTYDEELHLAGQLYHMKNSDLQSGPISTHRDSAFLIDWQRTWKLTKEEVDFHRNNWWKEGYEPTEVIIKWPGNGDPAYDMPDQMAAFFDLDNNGIYDPWLGDFPLIRGDECIFFFCNDDKQHIGSEGDSLRVEIHCMVYSYNAPNDSILKNTVFVHYDLINRSENTYYDTYFGNYTHFSIGNEFDDYLGCSVRGNSYFAYNNSDDSPYGYSPYDSISHPAQSVTFLAGPYLDPDLEDNPAGGCDYSVNGLNFGNGIIDDERTGLSYFLYINDGPGIISHPYDADDYYLRMTGYWRGDHHLVFGGDYGWGYEWDPGQDPSTPCRYMFPGDTDPYNWGTNCELPSGGYNQNGKWWTEEDEDHSLGSDRKGMGSTGPFTFKPGDVQEIDMAFVFANSYFSADSSKKLLISRLDELRQRTLDGEIIVPNDELNVNEVTPEHASIRIYPNPARERIYVVPGAGHQAPGNYRIMSCLGSVILSGRINEGDNEIDVSGLDPGLYIISVTTEDWSVSEKFIKQ